jgi:hypothetical protein
MSLLLETYVPVVQEGGLNTNKATVLGSTLAVTGLATFSGGTSSTGTSTVGTIVGSTQALSGAGAVNVTTLTTKLTTTGANALTLADGVDGQVKIIVMVVDGGDGTLTPTTKTGFTTITFNDIGDGVTLVFTTTTGWICVGNNGATLA